MKTLGETAIFSAKKACKAQLQLAKHVILNDELPREIRLVAGVDVAYAGDISIGAVAVLEYNSLRLVESRAASHKTRVPYIPTFLSFREIPSMASSIRKLRTHPDLFLVDGQGFAHPRHCGLASHLGLVIDKPTIGVAKSRLCGEVGDTTDKDVALLMDGNEVVGSAVTTKQGSRPVYVSVGHKVSLGTAITIVRKCTHNSRIPKPLIKAHEIANEEKRKIHIASATSK